MFTKQRKFISVGITWYLAMEFLSFIGFAGTVILPTHFSTSTAYLGLGIVHADIRVNDVFFHKKDSAILCDLSASSPLGEPNLVYPDLPLPVNSPSPTSSEATDMFIMGSLIFQIQHRAKSELSVDSHSTLVLPKISTDLQILDTIIRKALLGHHSRSSYMLEDFTSVDTDCAHMCTPPMI